jgi:hypothetical protein
MKKTMKPLLVTCAVALLLISFKKDAVAENVFTGINTSHVSTPGKPVPSVGRPFSEHVTVIVQTSRDLFEASLRGQVILAEPSGNGSYRSYGSTDLGNQWYGGGSVPTPRENCEAAAAAFALYVSLNQVAFQSAADNSGQNKTVSRQYPGCPTLFTYTFHPRNPGVCPECFTYTEYSSVEVEMMSEME